MFQETSQTDEVVEVQEPPRHRAPRPLSEVFETLAAREKMHGPVSISCIRDALADRSLATFLVITCLINLLPLPPGSTLVLGIPVIVVALQMVYGAKTVWLPEFFLRKSLSQKAFSKLTTNILPMLRKLERVVRPRYWPFASNKQAERVIGAIALLFGIFVFIPLPFTNWIPALAGLICGLALSERDGIWLAIGTAIGFASIILISAGYYLGTTFLLGLFGLA